MSIKKQYADNIKFHWDGRQGNLIDQSGNVGDGSFVSEPMWRNSSRGKAMFTDGAATFASYLSFPTRGIGDAVAGSTAVTIGIWFKPNGDSGDANPAMLNTHIAAAGQSGFSFRAANLTADTYQVLVGGRSRVNDTFRSHTTTKTYNFHEWAFAMAVIDYTNEVISIDVNGSPEGSTAGTFGSSTYVQSSANGAIDTVGAKNTLGSLSLEYGGDIREVIIFGTGLTSAERTQFYEESLQEGFIGGLPKRNFQLPEQTETVNKANLVGEWNMKVDGNQVADVSDNNNNGTAVTANDTEGLFGRAIDLVAANSSSVYMGDVLDDIFAGADKQFTMSIWLNPSAVMTSNAIISKYFTGTAQRQFIFRLKTDSKPSFFWANTLASGSHREVIGSTSINTLNKWVHLVVECDGTLDTNDGLDRIRMWVDGVEESTSLDITAGTLTEMQNGTASLAVGNSADGDGTIQAGTGGLTGAVDLFKVWTGLGGELAASEYAGGAGKLVYRNDFSDEPVSVSDVSDGFISDFRVDSGSWKITDDGTEKWLENVTAGIAYIDSEKAFGTWQFDVYKKDVSNAFAFFMASVIGGNSATGQDAYYIVVPPDESVLLGEVTNGTPAALFRTSVGYTAVETKYSLRVTRSALGVFTSYIKGGAFTEWTATVATTGSNPVTDLTTTTSKYFLLDFDAGDKISNIKFWEGVVSPL